MKNMSPLTLYLLLLHYAGIAVGQNAFDASQYIDLKNMHKVDEGIYRGSQPSKSDLENLEKVGIKEVLNVRRFHSDNRKAKNTNLKLHHVKVRAEAMNEGHLLDALKVIKKREGDILIHCYHGSDRTGAVVAMYRIVFQGWSKEDAIAEMKTGGYGFHGVFKNIPVLIQEMDIDNFKKKLDE